MTWRERIDTAKQTGRFTEEDMAMAGSWCQCAVGEWAATKHYGDAEDLSLQYLGMDFWWYVRDHRVEEAEGIYERIRQIPVKRSI